ncbi:MAG: bifunctional adenosylcobinamide kinase/adenosylcobinamide-phosphate guanylyltransferase [Campylobacterota bacterium]|nr:bifunctional adenosylcobinamide kinase/adenosylcobinamide-phosphate guanylyltransferase [Campylobacterota bacterium]
MKLLYFGGQKSGKSSLAQNKAFDLAKIKPYYIATYDNSFGDSEMQRRIKNHENTREDSFIVIEESKDLVNVIKSNNTYLIDCISMWILNNIDNSEDQLIEQLNYISKIDANIIFVLNDVTRGVIPIDKLSRKYVDLTGIIGQYLASFCDEVYEVKLGIGIKIK